MSEYQKVLELFDGDIFKPDFFPDAAWTYSTDTRELFWNTEADLDDLEYRCGETYSMDYVRDYVSFAGYSLFTGDDCFGDRNQVIFKDSNRHG